MNFKEELSLLIRSYHQAIGINTYEEIRAEFYIKDVAIKLKDKRELISWDCVCGFSNDNNITSPLEVLEYIENFDVKTPCIFLLKEFDIYWKDPVIIRKLKLVLRKIIHQKKVLIFLSPNLRIPDSLIEEITFIDFPLPNYTEIKNLIKELTKNYEDRVKLSPEEYDDLIIAAMGLTQERIKRVISKTLINKGLLEVKDISFVLDEKKKIVRRTGILEFFSEKEDFKDIAGLENLKEWILKRKSAFSKNAIDYGLPSPKGLLLVGIEGTGKSLMAKAISQTLKLPLLRLDINRIFGGRVGDSDIQLRESLKLAEAMAPCILWIDEIDKVFGIIAGFQSGPGISLRVLDSFISWLQEKKLPVFIVATANNMENISIELVRKWNFDEVFFVHLLNEYEREEMFKLYIEKVRPNKVSDYDIPLLAKKTKGFTGGEIEKVIRDAMYEAFSEEREFTTEDILYCISSTVPLSKTMTSKIEALQQWASSCKVRYAHRKEQTKSDSKESVEEIKVLRA